MMEYLALEDQPIAGERAVNRPEEDRSSDRLIYCGPLLGILEDEQWSEHTVQLARGDALLLYTDGITEAESPTHEFYGIERLEALIQEHTAGPAEAIQQIILSSVRRSPMILPWLCCGAARNAAPL